MTTSLYAPPEAFRGDHVVLPDGEAQHLVQSLRKKPGDEIVVVDGVGGWHRVRLQQTGSEQASGIVLDTQQEVGEPHYSLTIGLGLLKNRNRFETFLEKAVELGVSRILPLHTKRTEKKGFRRKRSERILIAAMKQSQRSRLPVLEEPQRIRRLLEEPPVGTNLICHAGAGQALAEHVADAGKAAAITILVGPEGGFSDQERSEAAEAGFAPVLLGPRRLRAETAAIAAAAGVMLNVIHND